MMREKIGIRGPACQSCGRFQVIKVDPWFEAEARQMMAEEVAGKPAGSLWWCLDCTDAWQKENCS